MMDASSLFRQRVEARVRDDSSSWVTGRLGLQNHVDSMVVKAKAVARALLIEEKARAVVAAGKARSGEQYSEEREVVSKQNPRIGGEVGNVGLNGSHNTSLKRVAYVSNGSSLDKYVGSALAHGEGIGDNQLIKQAQRSEDSLFKMDGPVYGNIPGIGPIDMGLENSIKQDEQGGKRLRPMQVDNDGTSAALPIDSFLQNQKECAAMETFVIGSGVETVNQASHKRKVVGHVTRQYTFEALQTQTQASSKEGRRKIVVQRGAESSKGPRGGNQRVKTSAVEGAAQGGQVGVAASDTDSKNQNHVMAEMIKKNHLCQGS